MKNNNKNDIENKIIISDLTLLFQKKIEIQYIDNNKINSLGIIHQPTLKNIIECGGDEKFRSLILPFCLSKEFLFEELKDNSMDLDKISTLELFFNLNTIDTKLKEKVNSYHEALVVGLCFFYSTRNIKYCMDEIGFIIDDKYKINKSNFDILCAFIRKLINLEEIKLEKAPKNMSDRQKDIYEKLMAGRKRNVEEKSMTLLDMINLIMINRDLIDYDSLLDKTYLQLLHSFKLASYKTMSDALQIKQTVQVLPDDNKMHINQIEYLKTINENDNNKEEVNTF